MWSPGALGPLGGEEAAAGLIRSPPCAVLLGVCGGTGRWGRKGRSPRTPSKLAGYIETGPAGGGDSCPVRTGASPWFCGCCKPSRTPRVQWVVKISSCPFQKNGEGTSLPCRCLVPLDVLLRSSPSVRHGPPTCAQPPSQSTRAVAAPLQRVLGAGVSVGSPSVRRASCGRPCARGEAPCLEGGMCRRSARW